MFSRPGERFADVNVSQRLTFGGDSVMVWDAFSYHDRTPMNVMDGKLNGDSFVQGHLSYPLCNVSVWGVFQDDNARPEFARMVTDFLRQNNDKRMDWLAYSQDLSPIKHAWAELGPGVTMPHQTTSQIWPRCSWQSDRQYHRTSSKDW